MNIGAPAAFELKCLTTSACSLMDAASGPCNGSMNMLKELSYVANLFFSMW